MNISVGTFARTDLAAAKDRFISRFQIRVKGLHLRASVRGCRRPDAPLINLLKKLRTPGKRCSPFLSEGQGKVEMISVCLTSGKQPDPDTLILRGSQL